MEKNIKLGFVTLAGDDFDYGWARDIFAKTKKRLTGLETDLVAAEDIIMTREDMLKAIRKFQDKGIDYLLVQNGTFAWGGHIVNLALAMDVPILLWALPEPEKWGRLRSNSLCGVNMNSSALYKLGKFYKYYYAPCHDRETFDSIGKFISSVRTIKKLKDTRIGLVGYRVPGFYGSTFDELRLRKEIGPEVVHIDLSTIKSAMEEVSDRDIKEIIYEVKEKISKTDMDEKRFINYAKIYGAFRLIAKRHDCHALAIKCWPELESGKLLGMGVCAVMSKLTDDGIMCGCEADMYGTVTMLMQNYLTDKPPFIVDLVYADKDNNTAVLWHCGNAPLSLAGKKSKISLVGIPNVEFGCKAGPITFAKLGDDNGFRMLLTTGKAIEEKMVFKGTTAVVKFTPKITDLLDTVIYKGFEHHFSIVYQDVVEEIENICEMLKMKVVKV